MLTLGIPTLTRYTELAALIHSAEMGILQPDRYVIIDNGGALDLHTLHVPDKITVIRPETNLGVAASWNMLLREVPEYLVISNDDVTLRADTLELLVRYADFAAEAGFLHGTPTTDANAWSFFLQRKWLFDQIGPYDEHFWPAYYEDNDYGYRMLLAGIFPAYVPNCQYVHVGSATLHAYTPSEQEEHHVRFRANQRYYIDKWGGLPYAERYTVPFGP